MPLYIADSLQVMRHYQNLLNFKKRNAESLPKRKSSLLLVNLKTSIPLGKLILKVQNP